MSDHGHAISKRGRHPAGGPGITVSSEKGSFTLIELMIVMVIIAVMAGLTFPVVFKTRQHFLKKRAKAECLMISQAMKAYINAYGRLPGSTNNGTWTNDSCYMTDNHVIIGPLTQPTNQANPRKMIFLHIQEDSFDSSNNLVDPWKRPYRICQDEDFDGMVFDALDTDEDANPPVVGSGTNARYSAYCGWPL